MNQATMTQPMALELVLPWQPHVEQDEAFKRIFRRVVYPLLLVLLLLLILPVFESEFEQPETQVIKTKVLLDPEIVKPEPEPVPPEPEKQVVTKKDPALQPSVTEPLKPKKEASKQPTQTIKQVADPKKATSVANDTPKRADRPSSGLSDLAAQLSKVRTTVDLQKLQKKNVSTSKGGQVARHAKSALGASSVLQKSEGLDADALTMKNESVALAAHKSTQVDGFVEGSGKTSGGQTSYYSAIDGLRSDESIRRVFESGKSRAYMHYLQELKSTPDLSGTVVFLVVIEPEGHISRLELVSSELGSPALVQRILQSVQKLHFGSQNVSSRTLTYKFNFLPS